MEPYQSLAGSLRPSLEWSYGVGLRNEWSARRFVKLVGHFSPSQSCQMDVQVARNSNAGMAEPFLDVCEFGSPVCMVDALDAPQAVPCWVIIESTVEAH